MTKYETEKLRELPCHRVWEGRIDVSRSVLMCSVTGP